MGMIALALFFIALARGLSGDFDIKFNIASTGCVFCTSLFIFYSIRYNRTIKQNKEK